MEIWLPNSGSAGINSRFCLRLHFFIGTSPFMITVTLLGECSCPELDDFRKLTEKHWFKVEMYFETFSAIKLPSSSRSTPEIFKDLNIYISYNQHKVSSCYENRANTTKRQTNLQQLEFFVNSQDRYSSLRLSPCFSLVIYSASSMAFHSCFWN